MKVKDIKDFIIVLIAITIVIGVLMLIFQQYNLLPNCNVIANLTKNYTLTNIPIPTNVIGGYPNATSAIAFCKNPALIN